MTPCCGDTNRKASGWPKEVDHGCGREMSAVEYSGENGSPGSVWLCPRCDGFGGLPETKAAA